MLSLQLAQQLKEAGLLWQTNVNDFFGLPDRGMDERVFVLADLQTQTDLFRGWPVITFHGSPEWALDYVLTTEAIWLPTESQLRQKIFEHLDGKSDVIVQLTQSHQGIRCDLTTSNRNLEFHGENGAEAYGQALLYLLQESN